LVLLGWIKGNIFVCTLFRCFFVNKLKTIVIVFPCFLKQNPHLLRYDDSLSFFSNKSGTIWICCLK
jgi:hypothetical protein